MQGTEFGQIYRIGEISELAECMEFFLNMENDIREKGMKARKKAEEFSLEKNTDNEYKLMIELLGR